MAIIEARGLARGLPRPLLQHDHGRGDRGGRRPGRGLPVAGLSCVCAGKRL